MPRPINKALPRQLLETALELLDERGDAAFSMRELAARNGYAVTAVYRCYKSRAELLRRMQSYLFGELARDVGAVGGETTVERIGNLSLGYLNWALKHPGRYRFMFENMEVVTLQSASDHAAALASLRVLEIVVAEGVRQGEITSPDPKATALILFSVLHGLCSLAIAKRLELTAAEDVVAFLETHQPRWLPAILNT